MSLNWKNRIWKYATVFVVVLIIFNPEMIELALFIDAVGLEMFIMLLEVQVVAILSAFLNKNIRPALNFIKLSYTRYFHPLAWKNIKETPVSLGFAAQSPAILMCSLVLSAFTGIVNNAI